MRFAKLLFVAVFTAGCASVPIPDQAAPIARTGLFGAWDLHGCPLSDGELEHYVAEHLHNGGADEALTYLDSLGCYYMGDEPEEER